MRVNNEEYQLKFLALICMKVGFDSDEFAKCIVEAWKNENSKIRDLIVSFRGSRNQTAFFLFAYGGKIIGQLPLPIEILQNEGHLRYCLERCSNFLKREKEYEAL